MTVTVKKIQLWSLVVDNHPGALAQALQPLAEAGADLEIVMATAIPGPGKRASVGVSPITGRRVIAAARKAGFEPAATMPSLLVGGENRAGLGNRMSEAIAAAGINIGVAVAQVTGPQFSALFGFASADDAAKAAALLKKLGTAKKPVPKKAPPQRKTRGSPK